jgi:hypothetical protein
MNIKHRGAALAVTAFSIFVIAVSPIAAHATNTPVQNAQTTALPNDPCVTTCNPDWGGGSHAPRSQWPLKDIDAPAAWNQTTGSASVIVAVVDSGVNANTPELSGKVIREIDEVPYLPRNANHGTEVASIIAANTNNGIGIAGISWRTRILSVRVADADGSVLNSDLAKGIRDAADNGASIINVSIDGPGQQFLADSINYAESKGALVVAAAGKKGNGGDTTFAAYPNVLAVSGVDDGNDNWDYNNGSWVDVFAPADQVIGIAANGSPTVICGTSFATPHVSGAAALIKAKYPQISPESIRSLITTRSKVVYGYQTRNPVRLLDIDAALSVNGGYYIAAADGMVRNEGSAPSLGYPRTVNKPIVGIANSQSGNGYWLVGRDGGIYSYGDAKFYGSTGALTLNKPIVGMARTASGNGYWLVASDGGVFSFGDARFYGSTGAMKLNKPIVGMSRTASGNGYWLVASDGGIFSFGDARFYGSTGNLVLNKPIVSMTRTASGAGYWLVAADGGIFSFGDAKFYGSGAGRVAYASVTEIARTPTGAGYWIVASSGQVLAFGDAKQYGFPVASARRYVGIAPS